jgi:1-acylglycerone phosphate reductase
VLGYAPLPWSGYYNASKAALNLLTDQLRLELSPWGVKVILVVAGTIRTKFLDNLAVKPHLPERSLYAAAKREIEDVMSGAQLEKDAMDVDQAAEGIVKNALNGNPVKHQWIGGGALNIWFANTFGWATVWVSLFLLQCFIVSVLMLNRIVFCRASRDCLLPFRR